MRRLRRKSATRVVAVALLCWWTTACGMARTKGPPVGHQQMTQFTCTEGNAGQWVDVSLGAFFLFASGFSMDAGQPTPPAYIAVNAGIAGLFGISAYQGFRKTKSCRNALRQLSERRAR